MKWFGENWGAPICEDVERVSTPTHELCHACETPISATDQGLIIPFIRSGNLPPADSYWHLHCFLHSIGIRLKP